MKTVTVDLTQVINIYDLPDTDWADSLRLSLVTVCVYLPSAREESDVLQQAGADERMKIGDS